MLIKSQFLKMAKLTGFVYEGKAILILEDNFNINLYVPQSGKQFPKESDFLGKCQVSFLKHYKTNYGTKNILCCDILNFGPLTNHSFTLVEYERVNQCEHKVMEPFLIALKGYFSCLYMVHAAQETEYTKSMAESPWDPVSN